MALHCLPVSPLLKSLSGSARLAPCEKVSFTLSLKALALQTIPSWDHTGVPIHFHSSIISGSASWIILLILANVVPRQSVRFAIRSSISSLAFIALLPPQLHNVMLSLIHISEPTR